MNKEQKFKIQDSFNDTFRVLKVLIKDFDAAYLAGYAEAVEEAYFKLLDLEDIFTYHPTEHEDE